jgi:hypothetical protein
LLTQAGQRQHAREGLDEFHVESAPGIFLGAGLGIEVMAARVQSGGVRVDLAGNAANSGDARFRAAGVVEEEQIADLHVAQEIARLIVAHTVPTRPTELSQVLNGHFVGF